MVPSAMFGYDLFRFREAEIGGSYAFDPVRGQQFLDFTQLAGVVSGDDQLGQPILAKLAVAVIERFTNAIGDSDENGAGL